MASLPGATTARALGATAPARTDGHRWEPTMTYLLRELMTALTTLASGPQEGDMDPPKSPAQAVESKAIDPCMESALAYGSGP